MLRNTDALTGTTFDIVVVGGGIHGICVARDAALRGYSVALVERGDFGAETSHNSLKLVHGGMRYIQHLDFRRMRQSVRERRAWLRIAPHLVRPLKFAMQTNGHATRGPEALWVATRIHEAIGYDRNRDVIKDRHIPRGFVVGKQAGRHLVPGVEYAGWNGVACWYDGQMQNADRIMIECLASAVDAGAIVANYVNVCGLLKRGSKVRGVAARDVLTGREFEVTGAMTVNTAGPWVDQLVFADDDRGRRILGRQPQNLNMNLVTRPIVQDHAVGVKSARRSDSRVDDGGRLFFLTPWRGVSVIGTTHEVYRGEPDECFVSSEAIADFLAEVNASFPPARLTPADVKYCYWGLTPGEEGLSSGEAQRAKQGQIVDHGRRDAIDGLVSVIGVKWTTARLVAEAAVDVAARSIDKPASHCRTATSLLPGAPDDGGMSAIAHEISARIGSGAASSEADWLAIEYGTQWSEVLAEAPAGDELDGDAIFRMKVTFSVRREMAVRLTDVLARRTSLLQRGLLKQSQVAWSLGMMAEELHWSEARRQAELVEFHRYCKRMHTTTIDDVPADCSSSENS